MAGDDHKKYTEQARRGVRGEAYFESLMVEHAIPHRIARQNDLGVDFLCEWVYGDRPTGILFSAQVKSTTSDKVEPKLENEKKPNCLDKYRLDGAERIDDRTLDYWKSLGLPAFLFYVIDDQPNGSSQLDCYYKRYTPLLDGHPDSDDKCGARSFFRVNQGARFLAFADSTKEIGGFARDLVVDYVRLSYSKGYIIQLTPRQLGFWPFPKKRPLDAVQCFRTPLQWHRKKIEDTCAWAARILERLPVPTTSESEAATSFGNQNVPASRPKKKETATG
jgi:hypothetical protein